MAFSLFGAQLLYSTCVSPPRTHPRPLRRVRFLRRPATDLNVHGPYRDGGLSCPTPHPLGTSFPSPASCARAPSLPPACARTRKVDDAFDQMALYVFVYNVGWQFCFWCLGYPYLIGGGSQGSGAGDRGRDVSAMVRKGLSSPVLISSFVGVAIGLVTPLQTALFANGAPLRFLGSAVEILGQAAVPMVTCVISGTLGKSILRSWQPKRTMSPDPAAAPAGKSAGENGASIAVDDSTAVLMETSLPHHLPRKRLDTYHAHGGGTDSGEAHATEEEVPFQMLVILCFVRVVVVAGIQFWGISLLLPSLPKGTELMQLVVLIECCVPSANMIIVCCQQYGQRRAAEDLSKAYVMMFAASFASMVFFVSRALALTVEKNMDWADGQHL